ncbi:hypothetical protein BpHYR1_019532 [Brachionus plicatilis]|uniref:Uncharacterized protein n=1 Tax=Brachionus plicatilis TaxID=10195 RepID=A0A3M7PUH4_BRAPC|nr:hypothetical protein BpHYR1_019532 [Brachionus plicatilis]
MILKRVFVSHIIPSHNIISYFNNCFIVPKYGIENTNRGSISANSSENLSNSVDSVFSQLNKVLNLLIEIPLEKYKEQTNNLN